MDGFKNITISNYRGIGHLEVSDLARVNIIAAQNNYGKSTFRETMVYNSTYDDLNETSVNDMEP